MIRIDRKVVMIMKDIKSVLIAIYFLPIVGFAQPQLPVSFSPIDDRAVLCAMNFGRFKDKQYVGSTPMQDACRTEHKGTRERICRENYTKKEVIAACKLVYDGLTYRIQEARKLKNANKHRQR